uniref:histidine kinase n=1 Tax=Peronospora matthiolae TaxID=2874970 RepID=A0AAV1UGF4_9STRA
MKGKRGRRTASDAHGALPPHAVDTWPCVQELFRMLHDANAPALGVCPDGCVTLWNPRMEDITGFEAERVIGHPLVEFVYGMRRKQEIVEILEVCVAAKSSELELRLPLLTTTGRNAQVLTNMTPLLAEDGSCVGVYGVGQDVTEWASQEKQYATVMMQANAPIIELDKEGNITVWNSKTASMTGYASVDMVGEPLLPVVDESFRKIVSEKINQALTGTPGADFELPLVTARGSRVEIVLCLTPRFDTLGSVMGVVAIGQDVTERNTKEMEYRKLIETANAPIFGVDTKGRVVIFNAKAAQISEYAPEEVMGVDLVDTLISEEFRHAVAAVFQSAFQGTETANFEFPLVTKTGRKVEILLNATPRYDHTGKLVGVVGIGQDITDRIIQEKEYSRLIDTANAPIFGIDCNYKVIIWNKKAAAITEYTNDDTIGQELFKFISEDYRDAVTQVFSRALEGTGTANFDFPLITKSGRRLEILLNATPKYDHFGNISGAVGIGQDITDRRAQEQEYTRLIDTANAPIFGVDANGCVNIWNRKAADTTQYFNEEVLGANLVQNFIPEDYREAVWTVLSQALEGQETANFEFPLITKDGRRVEILLNATPRYNEKGVVIGVVGIGQDITIRMAQEQETNRLIHSANAPIFGVDQDGRVNIWNLKAAEITQYSAEEVVGKDLVNRFVAEEYRATVELELKRALEGEQTKNFEFPLITKTGRRVEILLNATPRYDELGQIFGVVGIGQDITERIAQEQELIRLIDTANAPIFGVDSKGRVNIWNKKAAEIMQYPTDAVMGEHLVEKFITTDYQEAVSYVLSEALNGVETANFEFPLITKAGRRVEILLNATPRYNEHGAVIGMVGIGQDITDRIAQEQEYMRLIDTANAPIFGVDSDGRVNIWNRKAAYITQYTNKDVLGKDLVAEFISEEYKVPVRYVLEKAFRGEQTANFEFPLITKSGRRVEILLNATSRYNEQGEVMGMVGIGQDITDRIAQEKEYMRLIDTANAPIFGVDINGRVDIWNRKAADIMQYTTEDVLGEDLVAEFISEEYRVAVRRVLEKAFEGVETANFEFPLITKAGRRVEILLNATPRYNEHGEVKGMVGIGQDITERIAQEQEYSRLIDTANAPIFGVDANMCVNIWNRKAAHITNYSIEEVMGENLVETFISPEFRPIVAEVLSQALRGVETANFEFPLITRPGTRIEILLNATPRYDSNGNIVGVVGIGQDITDRIAQEHEYFRLIDTANAPIFGIDTNGCINEWNQKIEEITGYHKSSVLGLSLVHTFITPECRQQVRQLLNQALIGIDVGEMELPMTTKRGVFLLLLVNASSKKDMHGNIRGVIGVGQDYTARKHMEAAKVNFLASFSHELRTPLNGVLGMLELLKEQTLDKAPERYVHMAYVSGSLLLNLINDILDLSKIEAGHLEISAAPFRMHELLDYSIEIFNFKARERGLKLELKCDDSVPKVAIGDVVRLRQVLLNLLSNAIKFTNEGSITVTCSVVYTPELPKAFKKLLFQVIDTGIGMDAEEKMRLFSLFTKLERTRQNNPTGSGLGLAICKQLAELMDGQIGVDSELDVGSNFYFTVVVRLLDNVGTKGIFYAANDLLPDAAVSGPSDGAILDVDSSVSLASATPGSVAAANNAKVVVPRQARILVAEDNEFNWEVVKCFLQDADHFLQWEVNGRDAVNAYTEDHTKFDLVFMDCEMPVMDGYTATKMIRQFEQENDIPRIPVLGLTAYAMSGDRQKCLSSGMDEFMVKPISKNSLLKAIRQWMRVRYLGSKSSGPSIAGSDDYTRARSEGLNAYMIAAPSDPVSSPASSREDELEFVPSSYPTTSLTPCPSYDSEADDGDLLSAPPIPDTRLAPASRHMQQLDLARAISNLELDDPMAIGRQVGPTVRTAVPTTSIFSLGSSVGNSTRSSSLLTLQRDNGGAIDSIPDWKQINKTSATLPNMKDQPLDGTETSDYVSSHSNPTLWSHPPFMCNKNESVPSASSSQRPMSPSTASDDRSSRTKAGDEEGRNGNGLQRFNSDKSSGEHPSGDPVAAMLQCLKSGSSASGSDAVGPPCVDHAIGVTAESNGAMLLSMIPANIDIPEGDPVDYSLGVEQCGGHEELFLGLLEKFTVSCDAIMSRIVAAYDRDDIAITRRESHSLKGSSAYVAAMRVSKAAFRVQTACEQLQRYESDVSAHQELMAPRGTTALLSLKQSLSDSITVLKKEHRHLRGYLRRNFEFRGDGNASSAAALPVQGSAQDRANGPCAVM